MKPKRRHSYRTRNLAIALVLLAAANLLIGSVLVAESKASLKAQIDLRMLDIANTAAYMLDGDDMKTLTADSQGSREYEDALEILRNFQQNIDLAYIYAINCEEDGSFTFSVDPTVVDPAAFGAPVVTTAALQIAAKGLPAADKEPYEDDWGRFYSAYSPVFDSDNQIACIVAVDFNAEWIEQQSRRQVITIAVGTVISLLLGAAFAYSIFNRYRKSAQQLDADMDEMASQIRELDKMMMTSAVRKVQLMPDTKQAEALKTLASGAQFHPEEDADDISLFDKSLRQLIEGLKRYLRTLQEQSFIDQLTGVGNRLGYKERLIRINSLIEEQPADCRFAVGFFDINHLERINTLYGFAAGDEILLGLAEMLQKIYGQKNVFRIASDEFIAVMEGKGLLEMKEYGDALDAAVSGFNGEREGKPVLSFSRGTGVYRPGEDHSYREVFVRAQEMLDRERTAYYEKHPR